MRRLVLVIAVALAGALPARPARADGDAEKANALLQTIATAPSGDARLAAAKQLAELGSHVRDTLGTFLARQRTTTSDERRAVLVGFGAPVPDKLGRFATPNREADQKIRDGDTIDWLAELTAGDLHSAAVGEITA